MASGAIEPSVWILDQKESNRLRFKRKVLEDRAIRIHQPRTTSIAVDVKGLENQVKEKKQLESEAKNLDLDYENLAKNYAELAIREDTKRREDKKRREEHLRQYWKDVQSQDTWKKDLSGSVENSVITFAGEDAEMKEREIAQRLQMRKILSQQIAHNKFQRKLEQHKQREATRTELEFLNRAQRLSEAETFCKMAQQKALDVANKELSEAKRTEQENLAREEKKKTGDHIRHMITSSLLTEDPRVAKSAFGPHRVLCDRWKGMSEEEKLLYREELVHQIQEEKNRQIAEETCEANIAKQVMTIEKYRENAAMANKIKVKKFESELMEQNFGLAEEKRKEKEKLERDARSMTISEDFFSKFGIYPR